MSRTSARPANSAVFASSPKQRSLRRHRTSARRSARSTTPRRKRSHADFGFGVVFVNPALAELDWDPSRFAGTAFENARINPVIWNAFMGWTGIDQYDEGNPVGQQFLDEFKENTGRRPEWCVPVVNRDVAVAILHAVVDAHPLSPRGVKEALERVKSVPAASGAPGTRISFGNWTRRDWMGSGYLCCPTAGTRRCQLAPRRSIREA